MSDKPFFAKPNLPPPPPRQPVKGEPIWSLQKGVSHLEAELRYHGEYGVETQLFRDGELLVGRLFISKALALQWGEEERAAFERDGWKAIAP